ncbi:MAG: DUF1320 domain-containing protein [Flavobacteriales bacterium]|nr:DUF1320 domain-containing protein [Flavobacteriales bacterium]
MNDLITRKHYTKRIDKGTLSRLLRHDLLSKEEVRIDEEAIAFSIIDCHLQELYETDGLFSPQMSKSGLPLAEWVVSMVLHQLYSKTDESIPDAVMLNYVSTMQELEDIRTGKLAVELPTKDRHELDQDMEELDPGDDPDFESPMFWGI